MIETPKPWKSTKIGSPDCLDKNFITTYPSQNLPFLSARIRSYSTELTRSDLLNASSLVSATLSSNCISFEYSKNSLVIGSSSSSNVLALDAGLD